MPIDLNITTTFLGNTDTPSTYAGAGGYKVKVNAGATALEFVSDSGGGANIYNTSDSLTGNRVVTLGAFTLQFYGGGFQHRAGSGIFDSLVSYRNNANTADMITIYNDGKAYFYQNIYSFATNFMETIKNPYFLTSGFSISSGIEYNSRGEIGSSYTSHKFKTENLLTNAGAKLVEVFNYTTLHFSINKDGVINCPTMPTSSAGLSSGSLWSDAGTIKIV